MRQEAVEYYHSLLDEQTAADTSGLLFSFMKERKLYFGDRPLCTVLRPHFYTHEQFHFLKVQTEILLQAFQRVNRAALEQPAFREQFCMAPWEEEMLHLDRETKTPWSSSRLDSFYDLEKNTLQFVEYNAETPAGMGYEDVLATTFLDLPLVKNFQEKYRMHPLPVRGQLFHALMQAYEEWKGGKVQQPVRIAIIDWADVPTRNEHRLLQEYFESCGAKCVLADPFNLVFENGKLSAGEFAIDMIYKRVLASELFERMGGQNPIFEALRKRAVCMTNSFQALVLYKKASLAVLSDEANASLFTEEQLHAIHRHIPWTRMVKDRKTEHHGKSVDLLSFIADNRENLVIKPNDAYGGKGVFLGWETSTEEWNAAVKSALDYPSVVQEKVNVASEFFPSFVDGALCMNKLYVDADPFIFMGRRVGGLLTRLSSASLLNVTAGAGSAIPTFIVEKK